jgi:hypothetical protein
MDLQIKKAISMKKNRFHYDWNLLGLVLGSRKRLYSKRPTFIFFALFSRLLEAMSITQIRADANAPTTKYAVIKISAIVILAPFAFTVR